MGMNMNLKKAIATGAAAIVLVSSTMSVSAAKITASDYVNTLKKNHQENLIIDVDAYKAAYSDLAEAFGNDTDAYIEHYLTKGVYEGRTKGVLFDPLVYAESYSDVKAAFGYNIPAIVSHYVTFGITENRTQGTANGYADLAAAERAGAQNTNIQRNVASISSYDNNTISNSNRNSAANSSNAAAGSGNMAAGNESNIANNTLAVGNNGNAINNSTPTAGNTVSNSAPTTGNNSSNSASAGSSSNSTTPPVKDYHHTTSHYADDDTTLVRVEYYDANNKLINYSEVTNFDSNSNSYTENIYHYDEEKDESVLERTDTYVNGSLSSSEQH